MKYIYTWNIEATFNNGEDYNLQQMHLICHAKVIKVA
jgi:hypothetical protein